MLQLQGLTRRYGDVAALDDLSFTVAEGQMFGFLDPSGAGKTTAIGIILGVLQPDAGRGLMARTTHDGRDMQARRILARGPWQDVLSVSAQASGDLVELPG
jgi:ABC-2 type transport system ATP-binding protein